MSKTIPIQPAGEGGHGRREAVGPPALDEIDLRSLRALVGLMIPADATLAVPGADDDLIYADIVRTVQREPAPARALLAAIQAMTDQAFGTLDPAAQEATAQALFSQGSAQLNAFFPAVVQCYYRDDRVMRSLGMEPRPPFPKGFELEQGDWSLLDAVRARPKVYRDVT